MKIHLMRKIAILWFSAGITRIVASINRYEEDTTFRPHVDSTRGDDVDRSFGTLATLSLATNSARRWQGSDVDSPRRPRRGHTLASMRHVPSQGNSRDDGKVRRRIFLKGLLDVASVSGVGLGRVALAYDSDDVVERFRDFQYSLNDLSDNLYDVIDRLNEMRAEDENRTSTIYSREAQTALESNKAHVDSTHGDDVYRSFGTLATLLLAANSALRWQGSDVEYRRRLSLRRPRRAHALPSMQNVPSQGKRDDGNFRRRIFLKGLLDVVSVSGVGLGRAALAYDSGDVVERFRDFEYSLNDFSDNLYDVRDRLNEMRAEDENRSSMAYSREAQTAVESTSAQVDGMQQETLTLQSDSNSNAEALKEKETTLETEVRTKASLEAQLAQQEREVSTLESLLKEAESKSASERMAAEAATAEARSALEASQTQANQLQEEAGKLRLERDAISVALKEAEGKLETELKTKATLESKLAKQERDLRSLESLLEKAEAKIAKDRAKLESSTAEERSAFETSKAQAAQLQEEARALRSERNTIAETLRDAEVKLSTELKAKTSLEAKLAQQERDMSSLESRLKDAESKAAQDRTNVESSTAEALSALEASKAQANGLQEEARMLRQERNSIASSLKESEAKLAEELKTKQTLKAKLAQQKKDVKSLEASLRDAKSKSAKYGSAPETGLASMTSDIEEPMSRLALDQTDLNWKEILVAAVGFVAVRANFQTQFRLTAVKNKLADKEREAEILKYEFDSLRSTVVQKEAQKQPASELEAKESLEGRIVLLDESLDDEESEGSDMQRREVY